MNNFAFHVVCFMTLILWTSSSAPIFRGTKNNNPDTKKPYIETHNSTFRGYGPREEARAMCSVKTHEINASANATITRRLHGVATTRQLRESVQRLELVIFGQMQQLWQSLENLQKGIFSEDHPVNYLDKKSFSYSYK